MTRLLTTTTLLFRPLSTSPRLTFCKFTALRKVYMSSASSAPPKGNDDITKWASGDGHFRRQASTFRDVIAAGGDFAPEKDRYHLYVRYILMGGTMSTLLCDTFITSRCRMPALGLIEQL